MAITRERIARALENYIPSSIAVPKDPETNVTDPKEAFSKLQTVVSSAMALDPNSLFYLVSLVLGEVLGSAESIIADIDTLASQEVLMSAEQTLPPKITDTSDLLKASTAISDLTNSSSAEAATNLDAAISDFQNNHLKSLVQRRNIKIVEEQIQTIAADLSGYLTDMNASLARVTDALGNFETVDVKGIALTQVAKTARARILQIKAELEEASNEEQASLAEEILVDLAAAKVALTSISGATSPRGSIVVPATSDASTKQTYLTAQGAGSLVPRTYVAKGPSGNLFSDYLLASTKGSASASEYEVTAALSPEKDLSFPISVLSPGDLIVVANGVSETISFGTVDFFNVDDFISFYNASASITQAFKTESTGRPFSIHAFNPSIAGVGANPVGKASTISVGDGSSESVLSALSISSDASAGGSLGSTKVKEGALSLSSFTFPSTTTTFMGTSFTSFDCTLTTLDGAVRKITAVDTTNNTISVTPKIPVAPVTASDGTVTYSGGPFRYVVTKSANGTLFQSGSGGNTTPLVDDPDGLPLASFLISSLASTGSTDSTRVRNPNKYVQATASIAVNIATASAGDSITVGGAALTAVSGAPSSDNAFEIGVDSNTTAQNIVNAINSTRNSFSAICTATRSTNQVNLVAAYYNKRGTAGNSVSLATSNAAAFSLTGFSGGVTPGTTWGGLGEYGALEKVVRASGSDGTNLKEFGAVGKVGKRKASGTAGGSNGGVTVKGYASESTANWYAAADGEWGKKIAESTATVGDAASPGTAFPTNVFVSASNTAADWTTNASQINFDGTGHENIAVGHYFVMIAWASHSGSAIDTGIRGPSVGVGPNSSNFPSPPHYQGAGGTVFYISAVGPGAPQYFSALSPFIDSDGDGDEDGSSTGVSWSDKGWTNTNVAGSSHLTLFGYVFNPDKFIINTASKGFLSTYTEPSGAAVTPANGHAVFYEYESGGTKYRNSQAILGFLSNLECSFSDTGGTNGSNDFMYRSDDPWRAQSPKVRTGVKYTFVKSAATALKRFFAKDVDLVAAGVVAGDLLYISTSGSNQGWYMVASIETTNQLLINASPSGSAPDGSSFKTAFAYPENVSWEVRDANYAKRITDSNATFVTNGTKVGDTVTITATSPTTLSFHGSYEIAAVESETSLLVTAQSFPNLGSAAVTVTYRVPQNDSLGGVANNLFRSPSSSFFGSVVSGDILNVGSADYEVDSVEASDILKIKSHGSGPSVFATYFTGQAFTVRRGAETSGTYAGQETTNLFKIQISSESGLTDLKNVGGIEVSSRIDIDTSTASDIKDGYLVIKEGTYAGTYAISSVSDLSGNFQTVTIDTFLPFTDPPSYNTSWEALAGKTTSRFLETGSVDRFLGTISSSSAFSARAPEAGDSLLVEFSGGTSRFIGIKSVEFDDEILLDEELEQGLSSLRYSLLPAEFPQIGNELVVGGHRRIISDVRLATNKKATEKAVLVLDSGLPLTLGSDLSYFVVTPGADPFSAFLEDSDPNVLHDLELTLTQGFKTPALGSLVGQEVQLSDPQGSFRTTVSAVVNNTTLRLAQPIESVLDDVFYRVFTGQAGKSSTLTHQSDITTAISGGEYLSIWQSPMYQTVTKKEVGTLTSDDGLAAVPFTNISFKPEVTSGLISLDFAVTRGGSPNYPKYLLLLSKIENLNKRLSEYSFSDLNLRLGEVLATNGTDLSDVISSADTSGIAATAPDDGDGDQTTNRFDVSVNASQNLSTVKVGDRVSVTYQDANTGLTTDLVCWVVLESNQKDGSPLTEYDALARGDSFDSAVIRCAVFPEIPVTTSASQISSWKIQRNSISFALNEAARLQLLSEEVRDIVEMYTVDISPNVDAALSLLKAEGYDRLSDLLKAGKIAEFFGAGHDTGSYQELMSSAVREAGTVLLEIKNV